MPLLGPGHFKENVRTLMGEVGKSPHVQSRKQALAIAYSKERGRQDGGTVDAPDYDYDAWRRANPNATMVPGQHYPDTYKLPNHPTFSDESIYHGQNGAQGGHWAREGDNWSFTPGRTNLEHHTPDELRDYFSRVEPGNRLNLPQRHQRGGEVGGLVDHDHDPELPRVSEDVSLENVMPHVPEGYHDPAYIEVIQRLIEGQKRLNALQPQEREQVRRFALGGIVHALKRGGLV